MAELIVTVLSISVINLVLGGDNAVVIAMASRALQTVQRRKAILWGTVGAVGLRFIFAAVAVVLLDIPYLMLAGGLLLTWIAYKLLVEEDEHNVDEAKNIADAIRTIIVADAVMSLDNSLAIASVARGHLGWLAFGILFSVPIIIWGSQIIANLMNRYPVIVYVGVAVLAWTAGSLIAEDPLTHQYLAGTGKFILGGADVAGVLLLGFLTKRKRASLEEEATRVSDEKLT